MCRRIAICHNHTMWYKHQNCSRQQLRRWCSENLLNNLRLMGTANLQNYLSGIKHMANTQCNPTCKLHGSCKVLLSDLHRHRIQIHYPGIFGKITVRFIEPKVPIHSYSQQHNVNPVMGKNERIHVPAGPLQITCMNVKPLNPFIRDIQRKVVLGMADIIENRDSNTGGHVKRTSDIIHIIVDEIKRQGHLSLTEEMSQDIVRAAPTHDLGKITIDSTILNKPGRLDAKEFETMKTHSAKSGEMVRILLEGVEEARFVQVAYNVARFHHERWDGRGYPEGLVGTMIPLEARIMAVADVYDALVSKRCYKEPMSFEQAADIMCENMGTQFDPNMESVFLGCRAQLEDYYRQHAETKTAAAAPVPVPSA